MATLELRPMTLQDVPAVEALAGPRNVVARDFERHLALEGGHGFVLIQDDRIVGATTVLRYFEHGVLGPILLDAAAASTGLMLALAREAVVRLQLAGVPTVEAEAAPAEEPMLRGLGFESVRRTHVFERPAGPAKSAGTTRAMQPADLLDVGALDAGAIGYGRKGFVAALRDEDPEGARVVRDEDGVVGYVLLRRGRRGHHLGPLVTRASDDATARALLADAVALAADAPVVALAPEGAGFAAALEAEGFHRVGTLTRMRAGEAGQPGGGATEWLIGSRMTG